MFNRCCRSPFSFKVVLFETVLILDGSANLIVYAYCFAGITV